MGRFQGLNRALGTFFGESYSREQERERNASEVRAALKLIALISVNVNRLNLKMEKMMRTLEETLDLVEKQTTKVDSLIALTQDLHQKVIDAMGSTITPSQQMRIDAVFDEVKSSADKVDAALTANTVGATAGAVTDGPSAAEIKADIKAHEVAAPAPTPAPSVDPAPAV